MAECHLYHGQHRVQVERRERWLQQYLYPRALLPPEH